MSEYRAGRSALLCSRTLPVPRSSAVQSSRASISSLCSRMRSGHPAVSCTICSLWSSVLSAVSGHPLYYVRSLWSSPVLCPQSLVISCTTSAVSGHLLYCVCSLWSSPVLCPQSLVISCTVSAVSGHLLYCPPL
ncbi:unnamed protein product [Staurois parvus]|uniref:Uncharacterized protein n=1 Tax=Staurois parvus TaxID=386267 RepID=A0ABN9CME0_9NEOB|nr:unnamed protein product [Staurois parvus]